MRIVDEDTSLNIDRVPAFPTAAADGPSPLDAFRDRSTGRLAVLHMVVATIDHLISGSVDGPPRKHDIEGKFIECFGPSLENEGHNPSEVFEAALARALREELVFDAEGRFIAGFHIAKD